MQSKCIKKFTSRNEYKTIKALGKDISLPFIQALKCASLKFQNCAKNTDNRIKSFFNQIKLHIYMPYKSNSRSLTETRFQQILKIFSETMGARLRLDFVELYMVFFLCHTMWQSDRQEQCYILPRI